MFFDHKKVIIKKNYWSIDIGKNKAGYSGMVSVKSLFLIAKKIITSVNFPSICIKPVLIFNIAGCHLLSFLKISSIVLLYIYIFM